jgi:hypothetical protein
MSLVMALVALVLVGWFGTITMAACAVRIRAAGDARWRSEGELVVATALASTRVAHRPDLDTLHDGSVITFAAVARLDNWRWQTQAVRTGALIRLIALAQRHAADGTLIAARRASLLLLRDSADTVRVLGDHPRF